MGFISRIRKIERKYTPQSRIRFWGVPWKRSKGDVALLIFAFILTSMSPSDLFPAFLYRPYVQLYALKALPCVLIWFKLIYEMMTRDYAAKDERVSEFSPSVHKS